MKIYLATDHAGFELKDKIKEYLLGHGYKVDDRGAYGFDKNDDYPDLIAKAAKKVSEDPENSKAIIFGGSGQGEAITANKFKNVRCAVFFGNDTSAVKFFREHNDANILSIGARFTEERTAMEAISLFLETKFSNKERHKRRIQKIKAIEVSMS